MEVEVDEVDELGRARTGPGLKAQCEVVAVPLCYRLAQYNLEGRTCLGDVHFHSPKSHRNNDLYASLGLEAHSCRNDLLLIVYGATSFDSIFKQGSNFCSFLSSYHLPC